MLTADGQTGHERRFPAAQCCSSIEHSALSHPGARGNPPPVDPVKIRVKEQRRQGAKQSNATRRMPKSMEGRGTCLRLFFWLDCPRGRSRSMWAKACGVEMSSAAVCEGETP